MSNRCGKLFTDGDPTYWDCTAAWSLLIQQMQFGIKKKKIHVHILGKVIGVNVT